MDSVLGLTWFGGIFVSVAVFLWRAELVGHGLNRQEFVYANVPYFALTVGKSMVWGAVLIFWLIQGRPSSPWKAVTQENGREVRKVIRVPAASRPQFRPSGDRTGPSSAVGSMKSPRHMPPTLTEQAIRFGKFEYDGIDSDDDAAEIAQEITIPLYQESQRDQAAFLRRLADEVAPAGGWAAYGADRLVWDLLTDSTLKESDDFRRVMVASIAFMRDNGVPPMKVRPYQWDHWVNQGGTHATWLPMRPPPDRNEAKLAPLRAGELRRVATLVGGNFMLVRPESDEKVAIVIEGRRSDDDPSRVQWDYETHPSLYDAFVRIGLNQQVPCPWFDPELEPFFPLPPSRI